MNLDFLESKMEEVRAELNYTNHILECLMQIALSGHKKVCGEAEHDRVLRAIEKIVMGRGGK